MGKILFIFLSFFTLEVSFACEELLSQHFVPTGFDSSRSEVGKDQVGPVKEKILESILSNPEWKISKITVTTMSSKIPFAIKAKKLLIDPESEKKSWAIIQQRAAFVTEVLNELKLSRSDLSGTHLESRAILAGPEFQLLDFNHRFVTKMTPGYDQKVKEVFEQNKKNFESDALIKSETSLLEEKKFSNLYQAKYKPFHGIKIEMFGCVEKKNKTSTSPKSIKR